MASAVRLSDERMRQLLQLAQTRPDAAFELGDDFSQVRNAHLTNTLEQLQHALAQGYNMMEGDVRLDDHGRPVMAHSRRHQGLLLEQWLQLTSATGRLMKLDFKDSDAAKPAVDLIRQQGIDPSRLVLNVTCVNWFGMDKMHPEQVRWLHEQLPEARIALAIGKIPYSEATMEKAIEAAQAVADPGKITFPLQAQHITPEVVRVLSEYGSISAWNAPDFYDPPSIEAEQRRLRSLGVTGMIDIRHNGEDNGPELSPARHPEAASTQPVLSDLAQAETDWVIGDAVAHDELDLG